MKKVLALSAMSVVALSAMAQKPEIVKVTDQIQRYNDNIVVYTVATPTYDAQKDTVSGKITAEQFNAALTTADSELGTNFGGSSIQDGSNIFALKTDYTDPTTGASFPAGYYYPLNASGKEFKLQNVIDATKAAGVQNVTKVVVYVGATASSYQPSSYYTKDGVAGTEYSKDPAKKSCILTDARYTVSLNGKIKAKVPSVDDAAVINIADPTAAAPDEKPLFMVQKDNSYYPTQLVDGVPTTDWTTFALDRPVRIEIDFTKPYELSTKEDANRCTDETGTTPITFNNWADHDSNYEKSYDIEHERGNYTFAPTLYFNKNNGAWDIAQETAGEPIAWTDELNICQTIKKPGYLLGFAIISGNKDAKTYFANVAESTEEAEATWKTELAAAPLPFLDTDDVKNNIFFSYKMQPALREVILKYYASQAIDAVKAENKAEGRIFNILGQEVSAQYQGFVIMNGKKAVIR